MANENNTSSNDENMKLDDANRVQVLSPGMMVAKRFFRNKLAIVGLVIIVCMFLFSFLGGALIPYSQSQVFYTTDEMKKDYAGATEIDEFQMFVADDADMPSDISSKMILALSSGEYVFETRDGRQLALALLDENTFIIVEATQTTNAEAISSEEYQAAVEAGVDSFYYNDELYVFTGVGAKGSLYSTTELGVACKLSISPYSSETSFSYEFYRNVLVAMAENETSFEADGSSYSIEEASNAAMVKTSDGTDYAYISPYNINAVANGVFLTPAYKEAVVDAINAGDETFYFTNEDGEEEEYIVTNKNGQYTISRYQETSVIATYESPSLAHICGTDANGMDLLARLMYGGRISLLIGFVVVAIELILGVVIGCIAGYFGGWVDNLLMRLVDIIYCIPSMPLYLIIGSIMDFYKASATVRIYALCIIMGAIGWVGIARIVRGQILSLREQEFMIATEATGISVNRRIFKHLIPNVIPQLVVFASMGVGEVILAESSLSFLGLGIKYPAASWGSIINAVTDSYVMTNYLFVWIPAGILILLTVLAFNFIGDGLRDAFDPRMKR